MLRSMTGYGRAKQTNEQSVVSVELRTVNNRHLKITLKSPDVYAPLESRIEKAVRSRVARGTVTVTVRSSIVGEQNAYALDDSALKSYWQQFQTVGDELGIADRLEPSNLLGLPGAIRAQSLEEVNIEEDWPLIETTLGEALDRLDDFRNREGQSMFEDLERNGSLIDEQLKNITEIAPQVVVEHRDKLHERVGDLLRGTEATVSPEDLIREVSIYADRCDINEEITRLRCHLEQFSAFMAEPTSQGRKLDFLSQEMFREVNTIGSKANNVAIAHCVVEIKAAVEKIREILANVE